VFVCGGTARTLGLADKIQETFGYPSEVLDPLKSITLGSKVDAAQITALGPALTVAVGLALRGFDQ
jgi:Tfp pilus assembly PilM family ATPase